MAIAFSVLSLKRNRSNSKESVSKKFSKLKSGFSLFGSNRKKHEVTDNTPRRTSLFQYFRNHDMGGQAKDYAGDRHYEYNRYHHLKEERNMHTLPTHVAPKLTSILIKRSGTTPSCIQHIHQHTPMRKRTCSNATISNMTINSEDLTAKEFADIAGIRILPEEEAEEAEEAEDKAAASAVASFEAATAASRKLTAEEDDTMESSSSCMEESLSFQIWDNAFWFLPEVKESRPTAHLDRKASVASNAKNLIEPPILHELRRMGTHKSEKDNTSCVIKKGRFEIQLALLDTPPPSVIDVPSVSHHHHHHQHQQNQQHQQQQHQQQHDTLSFSNSNVVEWKRKGKKPLSTLT
ncbi:hypothetical protein INT47_000760 [Mucor saturninus]|uniref:Uncharacterized protein n=1 Tax=Mucor saturninus TaxID=64648 RepID=A0A8H7QUD6_9FUNG|nr:hypothetical protein INT47_000760 [Mucor saturninus]